MDFGTGQGNPEVDPAEVDNVIVNFFEEFLNGLKESDPGIADELKGIEFNDFKIFYDIYYDQTIEEIGKKTGQWKDPKWMKKMQKGKEKNRNIIYTKFQSHFTNHWSEDLPLSKYFYHFMILVISLALNNTFCYFMILVISLFLI